MRPTTAGFLTFVACFALASPGVEAEPQAESEAEPVGGQCELSRPTQVDGQVEAFVSEMRQKQARRPHSQHPEVIVLNNRGYNYGSSPRIQLDQIRAEARAGRR